jgi:hypothetical protein
MRDFSSAILQQAGLSLALMYKTDFEQNIYYKNENIKNWAIACVKFWAKIQNSDGSFNEYYPFEKGFPPTAFSLLAVANICGLLNIDDINIKEKILKTAKFLSNHYETSAYNQELASISALYRVFLMYGENWILEGVEKKLQRVLKAFTDDGYFPEQGGADIGYLSVSLDMLGQYYDLSKDKRVLPVLEKCLNFLKYFAAPDGSIGGEYGSRNTIYFLANGLEIALSAGLKEAAFIKEKIYSNFNEINGFMDSIDDRYLTHYILNSFISALVKEKETGDKNEIVAGNITLEKTKFFKNSGLVCINNEFYTAIAALQKGGVIKIFDKLKKKEIFVDCGYRVHIKKGVIACINWQNPKTYKVWKKDDTFFVSGYMNKVSQKVSTTFVHLGLRVSSFFLGSKINHLLKKILILIDKRTDIYFKRQIEFNNNSVKIIDIVESPKTIELYSAPTLSLRLVASGNFFAPSDLLSKCESLGLSQRFEIITTIEFPNLSIKREIK